MAPRPSEDARHIPQPAPRPRRRRQPEEDRVTEQRPAQQGQATDRVTQTRAVASSPAPQRSARRAQPLILPDWRQLVTLAAPNVAAALSVALAGFTVSMTGAFSSLFVVPLVIPSVLLGALDRSRLGQGWRASAGVNLATLLILFPLLVIRQSTVQLPYLTGDHGTIVAAVSSTVAVLAALAGVAAYAAWSARMDPETAPLLFLPAAMLVPLLTSANQFAGLRTALLAVGTIFGLVSLLTLMSSLIPPTYTVFVGPIAVAAEVLFLTLVRQDEIFPVGAGTAAIVMFTVVVVSAVVLVVLMPAVSSWLQRVELLRIRQLRTAQ